MQSLSLRHVALGVIVTVAVLLIAVTLTRGAHASTYAALAALAFGTIGVVWFSFRNALPTDTVGQLLYRTEATERKDRSSE